MSRRAPPREYYEEDIEIERERDRYSRPRRRDWDFEEDDIEIRRRGSGPPVEALERLDLRERPPRDFMRESYAPPKEHGPMVMRRSRDEVDQIPRETEREEKYMRPPRERRRYRPREIEEEDLIIDERDMRDDRRRRSERDLVEDDIVVRHRERAPRRGYESEGEFGPRGRFDDERDDIYVRRTAPRRKPRYSEEEIEELQVRESEMERPRPRRSRDDAGFDRRKSFEAFVLDDSGPDLPRRRRSHGDREVEEELIVDKRERERPRDRRSREKPRRKEEIVMKWKDRPSPDDIDEDEIQFRERRHHRRRSPPDPRLSREPPGAWPSDRDLDGPDEEIRIRSRARSRPRRTDEDEEEEIVIRRKERDRRRRDEELALIRDERERRDRRRAVEGDEELIIRHKEREGRRASLEDEEIMLRKGKRRSPPREPSPSLKSIHAPPIHQDIITHHRHIDHGFDRPPRAPSPEISSTRTSFDEVDVHRLRNKDGHMSEEDIVFKHGEDEPVSPISGPSLDFNDPWEADRLPSRHKPKSLVDESESMAAGSSHSRLRRKGPRGFDLDEDDDVEEEEEEVVVHETRSAPRSRTRSPSVNPRAMPDEWSMVHTAAKDEEVEMSGALKVIEVAPKGTMDEEVDRDRAGAQVVKERRDERWTEITKDLVAREAIERLGYEFEETRMFYYIFSFMEPGDIDELVELSDEIRRARRRRIREMHRERATLPLRPSPLANRMPPRPRIGGERRVREREWIIDARR